jgi:hydrogenase/urease accessory protein HupE
MKKKLTLTSLLASSVPFLGFAHEGHGHTHGFTITHYFVEPEHLLLLVGVFAASILFFRSYFKKEKKA